MIDDSNILVVDTDKHRHFVYLKNFQEFCHLQQLPYSFLLFFIFFNIYINTNILF